MYNVRSYIPGSPSSSSQQPVASSQTYSCWGLLEYIVRHKFEEFRLSLSLGPIRNPPPITITIITITSNANAPSYSYSSYSLLAPVVLIYNLHLTWSYTYSFTFFFFLFNMYTFDICWSISMSMSLSLSLSLCAIGALTKLFACCNPTHHSYLSSCGDFN